MYVLECSSWCCVLDLECRAGHVVIWFYMQYRWSPHEGRVQRCSARLTIKMDVVFLFVCCMSDYHRNSKYWLCLLVCITHHGLRAEKTVSAAGRPDQCLYPVCIICWPIVQAIKPAASNESIPCEINTTQITLTVKNKLNKIQYRFYGFCQLLSFSQLFEHINWNIRQNVHNLKLMYQLPNQFCWTLSTFSALDSDSYFKPHICHNTTRNSQYLAHSSWIPSLGVHTEQTTNHISKLQRLLCN